MLNLKQIEVLKANGMADEETAAVVMELVLEVVAVVRKSTKQQRRMPARGTQLTCPTLE
jgi:hypothetical protein